MIGSLCDDYIKTWGYIGAKLSQKPSQMVINGINRNGDLFYFKFLFFLSKSMLVSFSRQSLKKLQLIQRLKGKRMKLGISQSELAVLVGTKQPAITRMESFATDSVSMDFILKVAMALDVPVSIKPSNNFIKLLLDEYF